MYGEDVRRRVEALRWYHTIDLGQGIVTRGVDDTPLRLDLDVMELSPERVETFDVVLFLGVLLRVSSLVGWSFVWVWSWISSSMGAGSFLCWFFRGLRVVPPPAVFSYF